MRIRYAAFQIGCRHVEMGDPQLLGDEGVRAQGRDGLACHVREKKPAVLGEAEAEALGRVVGRRARQREAGSHGGSASVLMLGDTSVFSCALASLLSFTSITLFCERYFVNHSLVHY